ncbi:hypothetical protein KVP04_00500 [Halobacterium salinarum]|uniref:hypothetical protein n=1 Tax=Halobacterium salinarum TaxID=2242 RepID=UPI001F1A360E|nr:hypothetical protein [Halobacterium salinarum]MCF2165368.1 hypothetical protein [Halobacterium salinarum]MCF2168227.1 hypothetical protein [Halobacterium salinarum]MCF2237616.1 hypothetical protein [Halobacterium salinarum]
MSEISEGIEGVIALVMGGFILLVIGSSLETTVNYNLSMWGALLILLGVVLAIAIVAAIVGSIVGRL